MERMDSDGSSHAERPPGVRVSHFRLARTARTVEALIMASLKIITIRKGALFGAQKFTSDPRGTLFREAPLN